MSADLDVDEWAAGDEPVDRLTVLEAAVAELQAQLAAKEKEKPPPKFTTLPDFVDWLTSWYRRDTEGYERSWCPTWWQHEEAIIRLDAVWRAFELQRQDPATGISSWIRDHVDVHMGQLMLPHGAFRGCSPAGGHSEFPLGALPTDGPPADWWTPADSGL